MKKIIGLTAFAGALAISTTAFAQGNSTPGGDRYTNNPGRQQATAVGAQCGTGAGSGAFGFFGKGNNLGIKSDPTDPGATGGGPGTGGTGDANSSICGQGHGNQPN
jgi:hypothetical protein